MSERTDEEKGTEPETTGDWVRDLEGQSDAPDPTDAPPTSEAGPPADDAARSGAGATKDPGAPERLGG